LLFKTLIFMLVVLFFPTGAPSAYEVLQTPCFAAPKPGESVMIHCSHNKGHNQMYWYRQRPGETMPDYEGNSKTKYSAVKDPDFKSGFKAERSHTKQWSLTVSSVQQKDEAVYLCAATYFGSGTKLTVLENGMKVTEPQTVKILPPSPHECRDQKKKKGERRKTLVCVASGFYPDHVTVFWQLNGQKITDGVATDAAAKRNEITGLYSITSRLRLQAKTWFNPDIEFSCYSHVSPTSCS
uniref:Ig-like domain-containing protein n=1 Tax=Poecilia latipinna TaxID=48699 RepID=A0A3B3UJM9_9TELE